MSDFKPLTVALSTKGALPAKFAADAVAVFKDEDRIDVEPTDTGIILHTIWGHEADFAVDKLKEALDSQIECGPPTVLYRTGTRILEPIMQVRISVPEDCLGDVIGDLNWRRALIQKTENNGDSGQTIYGLMPLSNMFGYFSALQQMAKGKGKIHVDFHSYEQVPPGGSDPNPNQPASAALRARRIA